MLGFLRRSRIMAGAMVFLAPGLTGSAVQALHPCPVDAPWTAEHEEHGSHPAQSGHSPTCQCIGSCQTVGTGAAPKPLTLVAPVLHPNPHDITPTGVSFVPVHTPSDLLPPATAPPLI